MDLDSAADHGFVVGDTYDVVTPTGTVAMTLTGARAIGEISRESLVTAHSR
ncbi:MAG: hypothetical protein HRT34_00320 [Alcanivorax sp.]|nr:hypothetical protein [Alcanivorax sp.]